MPDTLNVFHPYQPFFEIPDDLYVEKRDSKKAVNSIALFYQFMIGDGKTDQLFAVPDGCIDMIFRCDTDDPKAKVCGTVVKARKVNFEPGIEYFGVRLLPGNSMNLFDLSANDLVDKEVQLSDILKDNGKLIESIAEAGRFEKRIDCFFNYFVNNLSASKQMPLLLRYLI
ncbi:MAG: hypothetical protein HGA22_15255, partial [Clostridiales bacterium]|nr:hypothetical protein [Clostridiales bacterium]